MSRRLWPLIGLWSLAAWTSAAVRLAVTDDADRRVALEQPARRIVTLSPHATEMVYSAGAGDQLAAVAAFSDYPPAATRLPVVGSAGALDRERLLALQPDLIVAWRSGNRPSDLRWIDRLGIPVYQSEPTTLADIAKNVLDIGRLAGTAVTAERAVAHWRQALQSACPAAGRRSTIYLIWDAPLMTYGGAHWSNRILAVSGFDNVFATVPRSVFSPSPEAVFAARPAHIFTTSGRTEIRFGDIRLPAKAAPASLERPTLRVIEAIEQLCGGTHEPPADSQS
jgi:iron complex transport system substrate-binding protein